MKKYLPAFFILIFNYTQAQTIIRGTVFNKKKQPISGINITLSEKGSSLMLNYVITDNQGKYKSEYNGKSDSITINISGFNIKKQWKTIANKNQNIDFEIEQESIVLNEVKIKPPKIRQTGDTLNYLVDSFSDINDRTIGDVLKKMPGIEVKDNGTISYQNRPINKFYIENADLLQGRYGIATNNIEAKDVSTVQVMENHQPIKALRDKVFSEDAAINLKLKDSAKGTIIANCQLGAGGSPLLWNNELTGMYIAKKLQNISTYKGNNSGDDITRELNSFYSNDASKMGDNSLLKVQSPSPPAINQKRYLDNQANMFSINNLQVLNNDYQLTSNINYLNDLQNKRSYSSIEYYLPENEILKIEELSDSRLRKEKLNADFQINANKTEYYINNLLKYEGIWDRERGDIISDNNISQYLRKPDQIINNTLNMVKTTEKNTLNIYSFNGYSSSSQMLSIEPMLYKQFFEPQSNPIGTVQDVNRKNFASYSKISYSFNQSLIKQTYALAFNADIQQLKSDLWAKNNLKTYNSPDSLTNNLRWNKFEWIFSPSYLYSEGQKLNITLSLPVNYILLDENNKIQKKKESNNFIHFNPSLSVHYKLSAYWTTYINMSYKNELGGIESAYSGYIMSSYRNLLRNENKVFKQKIQNYSAMINYRNALKTWFATMHINYFNKHANLLYDNHYEDILNIRSTIDIPNTTKGMNIFANINKEIEDISSTIFLSTGYTASQSSQINQGQITNYKNQDYWISPRILTKIGSIMSAEYRIQFSQNKSKIKSLDKNFDPISTTTHNAQLNIFPLKGFIINLKYENFYNNAIQSGSRSMSFGDISVKYKWKKAEIILDYTNIFNSKKYISALYNDISRYYSSYNLRPAEVLLKVKFKLK